MEFCFISSKDKQASAAPPPLSEPKGSDLLRAWFLFSTVKIPFPIGTEKFNAKSVIHLADSFDTISK